MPLSDSQLLRAFVESSDDAAFAELVRRRLDFVYGAALRQVGGDAHRAEDIAQEVFIKLARNAEKLSRHPALLGWLCTATRFAAVDFIRSEQRRKAREQEVNAMQQIEDRGEADWRRLQPVLDEALTELNERDRELVLARYFDAQPFARIARDFGVTENAAQHRVERALDKLHAALSRRHITSTSAALGIALANQPGVAAPAWLAASITKASLAGVAVGAGVAGWSLFAFMSSVKLTQGFVGALAVVGIGAAVVGAKADYDAQSASALSVRREAALTSSLRDLEKRVQVEARRVQVAEEENGKLLSAVRNSKTEAAMQPAGESPPITSGLVGQRFKLARDLVSSGDAEAALRELLWCYDVGMPQVSAMGALRSTSLVGLFAKLGERYPPALAALRERRDKAEQLMRANETNFDAVTEYASINRMLKNDKESVAYFDELPSGDRRRRLLAGNAYDYLVENQRYRDAAEGRPYASISSLFESMTQEERVLPPDTVNPEQVRREDHASKIAWAVRDIEMLAGSGDLAHARSLAERLLAFDRSDATKALIQRHAERAGQPGLLTPSGVR